MDRGRRKDKQGGPPLGSPGNSGSCPIRLATKDAGGGQGTFVAHGSGELGNSRTETQVSMKMVVAIIQPFRMDAVKGALSDHSIMGMTVTEVRGVGGQRAHTAIYRGAEYKVDLVPKL